MKLTPLLEERNNKRFMLELQQRLIDDLDADTDLQFEDGNINLGYSYEPAGDGKYITVTISCEPTGDNVLIDVSADIGNYDEQLPLDIEGIMSKIVELGDALEEDLINAVGDDDEVG